MAKFDNAKVGDKVWSIRSGWAKVIAINHDSNYPIFTKNITTGNIVGYTSDGKEHERDINPALFWNEIKLPSNEEDRKPFNLVEFLRENLKPVEFNEDKFNYFLTYNVKSKELEFNCSMICVDVHLTYFHLCSDELKNVQKELNYNKVTIQQLKEVYKTLGWL